MKDTDSLLWQIGEGPGSLPPPPPIDFAGRSFEATGESAAGYRSYHVYIRARVVAQDELEQVVTSSRVHHSLPSTNSVTIHTSEGPLHVVTGQTSMAELDWTDEELCLMYGGLPTVLHEADNWWIAAYLLKEVLE